MGLSGVKEINRLIFECPEGVACISVDRELEKVSLGVEGLEMMRRHQSWQKLGQECSSQRPWKGRMFL